MRCRGAAFGFGSLAPGPFLSACERCSSCAKARYWIPSSELSSTGARSRNGCGVPCSIIPGLQPGEDLLKNRNWEIRNQKFRMNHESHETHEIEQEISNRDQRTKD